MLYTLSPVWASVIVLVVGIAIFLVSFILNRRTPKPKGCEDLDAECETCPIQTCLKHTSKKEENKDDSSNES